MKNYLFHEFNCYLTFNNLAVIKDAKHIWNPCSHLAAETGSCFTLSGQTSYSQYVRVMSVGQNVRTNNVTVSWGMGAQLGEGMRAIDFQRRCLNNQYF
jgi:hypothetical protein